MRLALFTALVCALVGAPQVIAQPGPSASPSASASSAAATSAIELARSRLDTMLRTGHADPSWFSASFLGEIPAGKVDEVIAGVTATLGSYRSLEFTPGKFIAHFAKGTDDVLIHLDADDKIDGLLFKPPVLAKSSLDGALQSLRQSTATTSYIVVVNGSQRAAFNSDTPLAVGSAFKLAVLNALLDRIARGSRHWSDVVPLEARWKSLPSGVLEGWPDGTPITVATYAAEMISISDNTAADALIALVGQNALRPYDVGNDPFLTTREEFILKSRPHANLGAAYIGAATTEARAAILKRVDALPLPALDEMLSSPELAIEWHYSVRALCGLMRRVADLPIMSINPGLADATAFRHVAYKGGSDTGVLNLTTMVTTKRGTRVCLSATLNDPRHEVRELPFETAYAGVVRYIESM